MRIARIAHPGGVDFALVDLDSARRSGRGSLRPARRIDGYRLIADPFRTGPDDLQVLPRPRVAAADARLLAPVDPRVVVGMAHNTGPADRELPPEAFLKPARSVIGPAAAIELPAGMGRVDGEAELAAVIGADGSVFGWTLAN